MEGRQHHTTAIARHACNWQECLRVLLDEKKDTVFEDNFVRVTTPPVSSPRGVLDQERKQNLAPAGSTLHTERTLLLLAFQVSCAAVQHAENSMISASRTESCCSGNIECARYATSSRVRVRVLPARGWWVLSGCGSGSTNPRLGLAQSSTRDPAHAGVKVSHLSGSVECSYRGWGVEWSVDARKAVLDEGGLQGRWSSLPSLQ